MIASAEKTIWSPVLELAQLEATVLTQEGTTRQGASSVAKMDSLHPHHARQ